MKYKQWLTYLLPRWVDEECCSKFSSTIARILAFLAYIKCATECNKKIWALIDLLYIFALQIRIFSIHESQLQQTSYFWWTCSYFFSRLRSHCVGWIWNHLTLWSEKKRSIFLHLDKKYRGWGWWKERNGSFRSHSHTFVQNRANRNTVRGVW